MAPTTLLLLDPLTLIGREFLNAGDLLDRLGLDIDFRHTSVDEEVQIAEISGEPKLVPPLDSADDFEGRDLVIIASDTQGSRHDYVLEFLGRSPDAPVIDLARLPILNDVTTPSVGRNLPESRHVRVAHPALVVTSRLADALDHLGIRSGTLAVVDPVSTFGRDAVELLAGQSRQRLQGLPVDEMIYGHARAFNVIATDAFSLQEEAAEVIPDIPLAVTQSLAGVFHGHLAHLGLTFADPVDPDDVRDVLSQIEDLEIADYPISLDGVPDRDFALITPPVVSSDRQQLAVTIMADGLRIGGALTAFDIINTLF
jgi:hypothetical protein